MSFFLKKKSLILLTALGIGGGFLFSLFNAPVVFAAYEEDAYTKEFNGTLTHDNWNDLFKDFVNTFSTTTMTGPLGIGAAAPMTGLNVGGPIQATNIYSLNSLGVGTAAPATKLAIYDNSATTELSIQNSTRTWKLGSRNLTTNGEFVIRDGLIGADRLVINYAGNIGIASSSPIAKLAIASSTGDVINVGGGQVAGLNSTQFNNDQAVSLGYLKANYLNNSSTTTVGWLLSGNSLSADTSWLGSVTNYDVLFKTNNIERMRILKGGNVGIGTSAPSNKFQVYGNGTYSASFMNGSVGIGITNPSAKLDVSGGIIKQSGYNVSDAATDNLLVNGDFEMGNISGWSSGGSPTIVSGGYSGNYAMQITGDSSTALSSDYIPVDPTRDIFLLEGYFKKSAAGTTPGTLYFGYIAYNANKVSIGTAPCGSYCYFAASGYALPIDGNWHKFSAMTTGEGTAYPNFPVGTKYVRVLGLINYSGSADAVTLVDHITLKRLTKGAVVVGNNFSASNMLDQHQYSTLYTTASNNLNISVNSADRMSITNAGNVGIGQTNPFQKLELNLDPTNTTQPTGIYGTAGDLHTGLFISGTGSALNEKLGLQIGLWNNGTNKYSIGGLFGIMTSGAGNTLGDLTFDLRKAAADTLLTEVLRITSSGNVGIASTSPIAKLGIASSSAIVINVGGGKIGGLDLTPINNDEAVPLYYLKANYLSNSATSSGWLLNGNALSSDNAWLGSTNNYDVSFKTNNTERMRILKDGNIGIGTSTPTEKLTISGNIDLPSYNNWRYIKNSATNGGLRLGTGNSSGVYTDGIEISSGGSYIKLNHNTTVTGNLYASGNVGIGTTTPGYKLDVVGNVFLENSVYIGTRIQGLTSSLNYTNLILNDLGGNVGIGTTTPDAVLGFASSTVSKIDIHNGYVRGLTIVPVLDTDAVSRKYLHDNFAPISGGVGSAFVQGGNSFATTATLGTNDNNHLIFETNNAARMTIYNNGNVGIGTTTPARLLSVNGNAQFGNTISTATAAPLNVSFGGTYGNNTPGTVGNLKWDMFTNSSTGSRYGIGMSSNLMEYQAGASGQHAFFVNQGTEAMRIISSGNVGIGTTNPGAKLEVNGNINSYASVAGGTGGILRLKNTVDDPAVGHSNAIEMLTGFAQNDGIRILSSAASSYGNSPDLYFQSQNDGAGWNNLMTIKNGGNVGIGTTNPAQKLEISGNLKFTSSGSYIRWPGNSLYLTSEDAIPVVALRGSISGNYAPVLNLYDGTNANINVSLRGSGISYFNGGNVGIGTTTPTTKLYLNGGTGDVINVGGGSISGLNSTPINNDQAVPLGYLKSNYSATSSSLWGGTKNGNIWNGDAGLGNVGIGTTVPGTKLDITGGSVRTTNQFISTLAAGTAPLVVTSNTLVSNLNADLLDGYHNSDINPVNFYNNTNATDLITTSIQTNQYSMFKGTIKILDFNSSVPTYIYVSGTMTNTGVIMNYKAYAIGKPYTVYAFNYGGVLCFHVTVATTYNNIEASITQGAGYQGSYVNKNYVTSITAVAKPAGTNEVVMNPVAIYSGNGGINYLPKFTDAYTIGNSLLYDNGTNVGIGTTVPGAKLEVLGGGILLGSNTSKIMWGHGDGTTYIYGDATNPAGSLRIGTGNIDRLTVLYSGNVGIGTTTPDAVLGFASSTVSKIDIHNGYVRGLTIVPVLDTDAVSRKYLHDNFAPISGGVGSAFVQGGNSFATTATLGTNDNNHLIFETNNTARMTIYNNGNVGIGTTTPGAILPNGWAGAGAKLLEIRSGDTGSDSGVLLRRGAGGSDTGLDVWADNSTGKAYIDTRYNDVVNGNLYFRTLTAGTPSTVLTILGGGNIGIGTTNPSQKLTLENGSFYHTQGGILQSSFTAGYDGSQYYGEFNQYYGGVLKTKISPKNNSYFNTQGGNVGIGTTTPTTKLYLNGGTGDVINVGGGSIAGLNSTPINNDQAVPLGYLKANYNASTTNFWGGSLSGDIYSSNSGNVGIGTTTPQAKFEVNGTMRLGGVTRTTWTADAPIYQTTLYGTAGDLPFRTSTTTPITMNQVYGPFSYGNPACPSGYAKWYKVYAEYVDNITSGGQLPMLRVAFTNGVNRDFTMTGTSGGVPQFRTYLSAAFQETNANHANIQTWISGTTGPYLEVRKAELWAYCL